MQWTKIWEKLNEGGDSFMLRKSNNCNCTSAKTTPPAQSKPKQTNRASQQWTQARLQEMHDLITKKAFELSEKRNFQPGHEVEDWLQAERMVKRNMRNGSR